MEELKHECGVALVRLKKPLEYYHQKYGSWMYGLNKLYLLMEKQHNRGQEGAGIASIKLEAEAGNEYIFRERALGAGAITEIFDHIKKQIQSAKVDDVEDPIIAKKQIPFAGEVYMGHLRYGTTGKTGLTYVHPMLRRNNWRAKCLAICGNFNLTNPNDIFDEITAIGQHPSHNSDTHIMLEQLGHRLDREVERLYQICKAENLTGMDITHAIEEDINLANVLKRCAPIWDGGYMITGVTGSGETFSIRDPWGIRTAFYYADDEMIVLASERPVIQTVCNIKAKDIKELNPGEALFINKKGEHRTEQILDPFEKRACSFERIYFSRGSDRDIYRERKKLGLNLVEPVMKSIDNDLKNTVFSFIPNTAEIAYYGLTEGFNEELNRIKARKILNHPEMTHENVEQILNMKIRSEKVAIKDIKLRTFIAQGKSREDLAAHVYDITYGSINPNEDNLVVIDDSIVRGTTLKQSIISILSRLSPKKIVIVSSAPQVKYPDYYGIDMSRMKEFIAFRAAIVLLKERNMEDVIIKAYKDAKTYINSKDAACRNVVKDIYAPFTDEEISIKMVDLLRPEDVNMPIEIVFQTVEGLHDACPEHTGDWYFTGNYPTPGGKRLINQTFIDYMEEDEKELIEKFK